MPHFFRRSSKTPHSEEVAEQKIAVRKKIKIQKLSKLSPEEVERRRLNREKEKQDIADRLHFIEEERRCARSTEIAVSKPRIEMPLRRRHFSLVETLSTECILDRQYCFPPR